MHGPSPQLLALCVFLALCAASIPVLWRPHWFAVVIAGRIHPEWATDPWIRRWIDEQELKQRTTAVPGGAIPRLTALALCHARTQHA
jgi:hypothetical protein